MAGEIVSKKRPSRQRKALNAGIAGGVMGAIGGALIGFSLGAAWEGVVIGGLLIGAGEAAGDWTRQAGEMKPFAWRLLVATFLGAAFGALWGLVFPDMSLVVLGLILGFFSGLFGLGWKRILLGMGTGLAAGLLMAAIAPAINTAVLGGLVVFAYRLLSAWLFRGQESITLAAERVPSGEIRYVVPFAANSNFIGADYFRDLARTEDGEFKRNAPGAGIVETMETMRGPTFDPDLVDPLIREFYEHTTRFKLSIIPVWKQWMKPVFWLYKKMVARQIGQANLPFNQEEAQRGVVSYIDTIDFEGNEIIDLRGWVRAFEETGEAIYVGIYTTFQHEGVGYVSVGFPLPDSNFTATLLPNNQNGRHFLLKSRNTGLDYPGHYLSANEDGDLTVLALPAFNEEIEVYVTDGELRTDHRFYLGDQVFLTLYYTIERARGA
jgi:hypothetical protein